jgi:hypothetical protein
MYLKLQQIDQVLKDPSKRERMGERYLSLKQCIWLAMVEWLLDLLVLPFIAAFFVLVPWRLSELFAIAVTQYENVPSDKRKVGNLRHIARDL